MLISLKPSDTLVDGKEFSIWNCGLGHLNQNRFILPARRID
jgi:hypothetical protein